MLRVEEALKKRFRANAVKIAGDVFLDVRNVREYLHILHEAGAIHIAARGKFNVPIYAPGPGKDVQPVPTKIKNVERSRKRRAKERELREFWKQRAAEQKAQAIAAAELFSQLSSRSILSATLFGVSHAGA